MDDAKKISEDVSKTTTEFMKLFTEKYISSTVGNKLKTHIKTTLTKGSNKTDEKEEDKQDDDDNNNNKEEAKENVEEDKKDNTESTEKDTENKSNEEPKEQDTTDKDVQKDDENAPDDKPADKDIQKDDEKDEVENDKSVDKDVQKDEQEDATEDKQVSEQDEKKDEKAVNKSVEEQEDKDDIKEDEKAEEKKEEAPHEYKASNSTGVYGVYNLKNVEEEKKKEISEEVVEEDINISFPVIGSIVNGYKKGLIDGGGNEYNAFNILYYKLSINDENVSHFGIKLSRYSRIRDYHEAMIKIAKGNTNIKNLKFPSKSFAFWKKNDNEFLDNRQKELNNYFIQSGKNKYISTHNIFQIFLGLKKDRKKLNKMKVFNSSLFGTCNKMEYIRLPSNCELNRFDTEQDMLLFSIMIDVNQKNKKNIDDIIGKQNEKLKGPVTSKINKLLATTVQKVVNTSWIQIEDLRKSINGKLDGVLKNNTDGFDKAIGELINKVRPVIEKKLSKKDEKDDDDDKKDDKDDNNDDEEEEEKEEKKDELKIEEIKSLNEFISVLTDENEENKSYNKLFDEYIKSFVILTNSEKKSDISKYLFETFQFEYGEYIKKILSKTYPNLKEYGKYESDTQLICGATAQLIQLSFELLSNNLLLIFERIDNKINNQKDINKLLKEIGENIAKVIGECDKEISKELRTVESNALGIIIEEISDLCGIFGNLLCCLVNDYFNTNNEINLKQSLTNNLNKYIKMFCESIVNTLCKSVLCVLVTLVKNGIKEDINKICGDKLEFDFIPKGLPDSIPKDILENVIDVIVVYLLEKNMKKKKNGLNSKIYQTLRSN